ncbi:MAG: hypothetical protein ACPGLV_19040, partial [Bacteroidia bacterium]
MLKLNAQDLVNQFQSKLDQAAPKDNLFLSTFTLAGENEWAKADIQNIFIRPACQIMSLRLLQPHPTKPTRSTATSTSSLS